MLPFTTRLPCVWVKRDAESEHAAAGTGLVTGLRDVPSYVSYPPENGKRRPVASRG